MPKVVPGTEVNIPEAAEVRVSTAKRYLDRGQEHGPILAVRHPILGWVKYSEWSLLNSLRSLVERIGPIEAVAWIGLTFQYAQTIKSAGDLAGWLNQLSGDIGGFFSQIGEFLFGAAIPETTAAVGTAFGGLGADIQGLLGGLTGFFGDTATRYAWAAVAAAITVLALKRGAGGV